MGEVGVRVVVGMEGMEVAKERLAGGGGRDWLWESRIRALTSDVVVSTIPYCHATS